MTRWYQLITPTLQKKQYSTQGIYTDNIHIQDIDVEVRSGCRHAGMKLPVHVRVVKKENDPKPLTYFVEVFSLRNLDFCLGPDLVMFGRKYSRLLSVNLTLLFS